MKVLVAFALVSLLPASFVSQTSPVPYTDFAPEELVRLISSSDFVATGTVVGNSSIGRRLTEKQKRDLDDLSKTLGGNLYTFRIDTLLFARTDFKPNVVRPNLAGKDLFIFKKRDTRFFQEEAYQKGQRYLIFLAALPNQKELPIEYMLRLRRTYYEAFAGKKGLILDPRNDSPLLLRLKELSEAIRPVEPRKKIERLNRLLSSSDPDLKDTSMVTIRIIKENMRL